MWRVWFMMMYVVIVMWIMASVLKAVNLGMLMPYVK